MSSSPIRISILVATFVFLFGQSGFAASSRKVTSKNPIRMANEETVQSENGGNPLLLSVGPGLISGASTLGLSLNAGGAIRVSHEVPIYAGIDTMLTVGSNYSYFRYGYYSSSYSGSVGFGVLASGYYNFTFPKKPKLHIIGGLSTGPFIGAGFLSLTLLMRPGFTYDLTPTLSVTGEPLFGIIASSFVFSPRALFSFKM